MTLKIYNKLSSLSHIKQLDDSTLVAHYKQNGDTELIGVLFKRYTHLVYGVCMKYLKDEDNSKDAVMQVFEKLLFDLKKHEVQNFKGWLHTVAKNFCLMQLRKKNLETPLSDNLVVENEVLKHREEGKDLEERLTLMEEAITQLNDQQKICVELFYLKEKCYQEIGDHTGYTMNEVKSFIQNGKRNLKIYMEKNERPV